MVAPRAVRSRQGDAAVTRIVALGFAYPDAIDVRTMLLRGHSHAPVRDAASSSSSALAGLGPDPGLATAPTASSPRSHAAEDERSPAGGVT